MLAATAEVAPAFQRLSNEEYGACPSSGQVTQRVLVLRKDSMAPSY